MATTIPHDMRGHSAIEAVLRHFMRHLQRNGSIERYDFYREDYGRHFTLRLWLNTGERRTYALREDELLMDGGRAIAHWIEWVDRDVWHRTGRYRLDLDRFEVPPLQFDGPTFRPPEWKERQEADKKAKDLFILTAGKPAFDTLEAGKALPITGSKGTAYALHKQASYCVERVKDKARLCAVVPGVPLWDHLLGIKLMVEHDEPKFLKTANVSGGAYDAIIRWNNPPEYNVRIIRQDWV